MSAPVLPAAPAARAPSTGATTEAGAAGSATPFASALDGALAEGRAAVGDGTTGEDESQDPGTTAGPAIPGAVAAEVTAAAGLPAALWALALPTPQTAGQPGVAPGPDAAAAAVGEVVGTAAAAGAPGLPAGAGVTPAGVPTGSVPVPALPVDLVVAPGQGDVDPTTPGTAAGPTAAPAAATAVGAAALVGAAGAAPTPTTTAPVAPTGATVPAPAGMPVPAASSPAGAGTGGPGGQDAGGSAPPAGAAEPVPSGVPLTGPASPAAALAAPGAAATGDAASLPVAGQVARHVAVLRGAPDGSHTMTLVLTPETLGPVEVSVTVSKGTVDLVLRGAHEHGRVALLDALPDLRRDLESAGLTTSRLEVAKDNGGAWLDRHAAGQQAQQGSGDRAGQQGPADGRSRPWLRAADSGETRTVPTTGSPSSGVDVRV
ncbi:flagellar hook-length control protein FliK [Blastococcus sp. TML/M2B]|uniref:flagellar hook-length control protein FliK n=1 Tax=unclassified Blastococcus TaxID=2619396 RepID=UPI00190A9ED3|nr:MULTISPECIES: flagellar hook-length control protein FliK [unclassified Blastococcus]MBN1091609.1 flagellar hook-length control protein FliK [Blastococcus sp. TML/M2B]MBN1094836.1 flagellar hook-length control protein FliK [Blastococcus sp. TML/C7B]